MQALLKNKLIALLLCAIVVLIGWSKPEPPHLSVAAQPQKITTGHTTSSINPNPKQQTRLKNPFKMLSSEQNITMLDTNKSLLLHGVVSQNKEFIAIIAAQGKTDFYKVNQKLSEYTIVEINTTSAVLSNDLTQQKIILHIKE